MTDKPAPAERQEAEVAEVETRAGADIIYLPDDRQRTKKVTTGSENRQRQHVRRFRTDDAEDAALDDRLQASGFKSLGEYVMNLAEIAGGKESRPRRRGRAAVDVAALMDVRVDLNRIGNNINQIARTLNELLLIAHERSNAALESMVLEALAAIRETSTLFEEPVAAIKAALES
jgi:hypothetical protein